MNYHLKAILFLVLITTLSFDGIAQQKNTSNAKTSFEEQAKLLNKLEPTTNKQYEKWLPKKVGKFQLKSHKINEKIAKNTKNNIQLVYESKLQKIEVIIVDAAKNPNSLEMIYFAFDMDKQFSKEKKKLNGNEPHHISKYNKEKKEAQILTIINKRFGVSAKANNVNSKELCEFVKKLNIEKLNKTL